MNGGGSAGDACTPNTPQSAAESFSYSNSGLTPLSGSGSDVGYNNGSGCANSPVYGNSSSSSSAAFGALSANSSADMQQYLIASGASGNAGFYDVLTSPTGGSFLITIESINTVNAAPACPMIGGGGNSLGTSQTGFTLNNQLGGIAGIADWATSDCTPHSGPTYTYGPANVINDQTVEFIDGVPPGFSFDLSASITAADGLEGDVLPSYPDAASAYASIIVTVVGLNGATYVSASGNVYEPVTTPEPASFVLAGCCLAFLGASKFGHKHRK